MSPTDRPPRRSAATLSADQLRKRYIMALSLIAALTIASQALMQFLIADQKHDSRVVNIAGRQRMLSQKITKLSYYLSNEPGAAGTRLRAELAEAVRLWARSHVGLLHGDAEMGLPGHNSTEVVALFDRIQQDHEAILAAAGALLSSSASLAEEARSLQSIREHETPFLAGMDDIVFRLDREANAKIEFTRWLEIGLMIFTLLVLLLEALFIFAPATRRIRRDMQELADREQELGHLFAVSPTALLLVDTGSLQILRANDKATKLTGFSLAEMAQTTLRDLLDQDYEANRSFLEKINQGESLNEYEVVLLDSKRSVFESLVSVRPIRFGGQAVFVVGITNIAELKRAQQTLQHYATFDEMTGLMNRRTGMMLLGKSMARVRRDGGTLTVCYADLDSLKAANDRFGHSEGDWLIRTVAQVLAGVIRSSDAAVRLGGDEFMLMLHDCSREEAIRLLARAEARLQEIGSAEQKPFPMSFSSGIAIYSPEKHESADALIAEADGLMYHAKQEKKRLAAPSG